MSDTIAAIATAPGQGGIAIVRVSGDMGRTFYAASSAQSAGNIRCRRIC